MKQGDDEFNDVKQAVELVNTVYLLADPPDRLTSIAVFQDILVEMGAAELAQDLRPEDLDRLRTLRDRLVPIFAADHEAEVAALVNPVLLEAGAVPQLIQVRDGSWKLRADGGRRGIEGLEARLPAALAAYVTSHGTQRLGVCHARPCECVYVDRTRAATRRYCCDQCNDRAAAAAYRLRAVQSRVDS